MHVTSRFLPATEMRTRRFARTLARLLSFSGLKSEERKSMRRSRFQNSVYMFFFGLIIEKPEKKRDSTGASLMSTPVLRRRVVEIAVQANSTFEGDDWYSLARKFTMWMTEKHSRPAEERKNKKLFKNERQDDNVSLEIEPAIISMALGEQPTSKRFRKGLERS